MAQVRASRWQFRCRADDSLDKGEQLFSMRYAATRRGIGGDRRQIVPFATRFTALTEQGCMAGGSIETSVERRGPGRDQLDLGMSDGAILGREIADLVVLQV